MSSPPTGDGPDEVFAELVRARRGRLLRAIFETEPQCVKLLGSDGSLRLINPAGLRMIEADSYDEVRGHCVYPLVVEEDRPAFQALTERVFRGESASLEFRMVGLKGTPRWLEMQAVPLRDDSGRVSALLGITSDITDRVLANAALRRSEQNFRMLSNRRPTVSSSATTTCASLTSTPRAAR
jgi:PAS domain S-box-containing protein